MKRGIFIGRFQPFHIGHLSVVDEMQRAGDLDEAVIGVGSAQFSNELYNPFTAEEREEMVRRSVSSVKPYHIVGIRDINNWLGWVDYVKSVSPEFHVAYSGNTIVKNLFEDKGYEVRTPMPRHRISATEIRDMMVGGGTWEDWVPAGARDVIYRIDGVSRLKELRKTQKNRENPLVMVDVIIDYKDEGIVLVKRKYEPFRDFWAFPGGHHDSANESVEQAAAREAREETSLDIRTNDLHFLGVYSAPGRDPRGPTVSLAYHTWVEDGIPKAQDDAKEIGVFPYDRIPKVLAFDHNRILEDYFINVGASAFG